VIKTLEIKNFKSIEHLTLDCRRINLFIGEPNTGKSNILETFGLLSFLTYNQVPRDFFRFEGMSNLFYDENLDENITIKADETVLTVVFKDGSFDFELRTKNGTSTYSFNYDGSGRGGSVTSIGSPFKLYKFSIKKAFPLKLADFLRPPSGENLIALLLTHKSLKTAASQLFEPFGLKLVFRIQENKIEVMKQQGDVIITYPYSLTSDTLQRILFHMIAIDSNKDSVLIFEEPESNSFPYYTKFLGERIAEDESNQYFVATHNPYLLLAILEKAKKNSVNVFVTYFKDYQTRVKCLTDDQISELMKYDPFFNLGNFIEEGDMH
jgi:AAA15 family ATPase/GTPase